MPTHEFTVTLSTGKKVTQEYEAEIVNDPNYGADADGRRGISMDFLEDLGPTTPTDDPSWLIDDDGNALTEAEKAEAIELLDKAAEDHEWEPDEPDYPDYDGDDE